MVHGGLTALRQEYEALEIWKRRLRWVGREVIGADGWFPVPRLEVETARAAGLAAPVAAALRWHGCARPRNRFYCYCFSRVRFRWPAAEKINCTTARDWQSTFPRRRAKLSRWWQRWRITE